MSAIYKLSIQGIRSFDSNDRETIEFGTPLTLIVGTNGSGKTTIIECLKYATTGDLPPNSKGGVFVHDPKITGEKDIRAQVKLAFTSANGLNMIVTRNIQLLAKKTTNTFKTLEGQLVAISRSGGRTTLSTRATELDTQVPLYMGVPKAILEYVIFCHQEDSLWPLSEPANLKKKFDEIFQAMKFTKAIDNLKIIKKDMAVDIKLLKQSVEHLKVDRDRSKNTKRSLHNLEAKYAEYQEDVKAIEVKLNDITRRSDELFKSNQDFQEVLSKSENLKTLESLTSNEIERLSSSINAINLGKSELQDLLDNFSNTLHEKELEVQRFEEELFAMKDKSKEFQNNSNSLARRQGELEAELNKYALNKTRLTDLQSQMSTRYGFEVSVEASNFIDQLKHYKEKFCSDLDRFEETESQKIKDQEEKLSKVIYSDTVQAQKLDYYKADKNKLLDEISNMESEIITSEYSEDDLEKEKKILAETTLKLEEWEKSDVIKQMGAQLKEKNEQILLAENDLEEIQDKIKKTNQQADLFAKLGLLKKSIAEKSQALENASTSLENNSKAKSWNLMSNDDLDIDFKKIYINLQKQIALSNRELHECEKKFTESSYNLTTLQNDLVTNQKTENDIKRNLENALPEDCPLGEYDKIIEEAELSYRTALENLKMHQTTLDFNRKALEVAEYDNSCYLCLRSFDTVEFKNEILQNLKAKTEAKFETALKEVVKEEKEFLDSLRSLEKDFTLLNSSWERINKIKIDSKKAQELTTSLREQLLTMETKNNELKEDQVLVEKELRAYVETIITLKKELKQLDAESSQILEQLKIYGSSDGEVFTVDELQQLQKNKSDHLRGLRKAINELQMAREGKIRGHSALITTIKKKTMAINEMERSLVRKQNTENNMKSKRNRIKEIESKLGQLTSEVDELHSQRIFLEQETNNVKAEFNSKMSSKRDTLNKINNDINTVSSIWNEITQYDESLLSQCTRELERSELELAELNQQIDFKNNELNDQKQKLKDSNNEKRNLSQNIELLDLKKKLNDIKSQINSLDIQNAKAKRDKYQHESSQLRNEYEKLSAENAGRLGEMKQLQNQINSLQLQLRSDFKDVDNKFHKEWVELQTRTLVTDDIDTYSKALDSAIMRYHGLKMEDINRIIDELWKRTYSGTDIDTIKIRSDEVSSTVRGKSYNYRVVMYKQDAELDMRGRCSAGQKVLASIIIRLALSETFGINCGVIALDEPTTNLDEENIESLAKSLNNIIHFRRHQKNFQLIVITHDEKFLSHMGASQFADHFFKVRRDDRQKSQIEWVDINKVSEY
ncbi:hypothetical protein KAFR_0D03760 [Kazachstania africana CBS 2517]|uniref:DNA repair protein RAD50 n=1 Tax=Kazachstania africana (strain ATCC 22294 / BCRC 22015 / CBS 2517 / CECT 1963 / NBRC 1671 / NRRL Y-8276) TaxID=1071382 RepID=H2AUH4_KAZAF|nr:hypothetical protein KAFR_0D03760 [Kazachstania africana CBS 2517]CCF58024.1 hypothetical protein KAFR_0D03760 [Kazachstania africana CBS 2517]